MIQAGAAIYVGRYGSLEEAGYFTLAFAIFAPVNLFAGMGLANLILSGDSKYQNYGEIITARSLLSAPLSLIALCIFSTGNSIEVQTSTAMIGLSRFVDLTDEIVMNANRLKGYYASTLASSVAAIIVFTLSLIFFTDLLEASTLLCVSLSFLVSSIAGLLVDVYHFNRTHGVIKGSVWGPALKVISGNWYRGMANFGNSISANIPRYLLHYYASPAAQGAYSILISLSRLGMIAVQSILIPRLKTIRDMLSENLDRWFRKIFIQEISACVTIFTAISLAVWSLINFIGFENVIPGISAEITTHGYIAITVLTLILFIRFSTWTLASITLSSSNQIAIVSLNVLVVLISGMIGIPEFDVTGAALSEILGHGAMILLIMYLIRTRGVDNRIRGKNDVLILKSAVQKFTAQPIEMARKYDFMHRMGVKAGFTAPAVLEVRADSIIIEKKEIINTLRDIYILYNDGKYTTSIEGYYFKAGAVLASVHSEPNAGLKKWKPSQYLNRKLPPHIQFPAGQGDQLGDLVVLHGDYSFTNVCISREHGQSELCIIDPCPNGGSTFNMFEQGPRYVDIGIFVACLWGQIPIWHALRMRKGVSTKLTDAFLRGYEVTAGISLDRELVSNFAYAAVSAQFEYRFGLFGRVRAIALSLLKIHTSRIPLK